MGVVPSSYAEAWIHGSIEQQTTSDQWKPVLHPLGEECMRRPVNFLLMDERPSLMSVHGMLAVQLDSAGPFPRPSNRQWTPRVD